MTLQEAIEESDHKIQVYHEAAAALDRMIIVELSQAGSGVNPTNHLNKLVDWYQLKDRLILESNRETEHYISLTRHRESLGDEE